MSHLRNSKSLRFWAVAVLLGMVAYAWADHLEVKNGTSWLEAKGDSSGNFQVVGGVAQGASGSSVNPVLTGLLDGSSNLQPYKGTQNVQLLASAARTTQQTLGPFANNNFKGITFYLNVTAASGTGGLSVYLQYYDPVSTTAGTLWNASASVTATGIKTYTVYPQTLSGTGLTATQASILPANYQVQVRVGDASSYTYSLSSDLLAY